MGVNETRVNSLRRIVVVGPTAGGKSDFAVGLAERLGGAKPQAADQVGDQVGSSARGKCGGVAILSADSMQVYRQMDAGTAKPSRQLRDRVVHHLVDVVEPSERFTVHDWLSRAEAIMGQLRDEGKLAIVVGGTNLYVKALLEGMFDGPGIDAAFRAELADVMPQVLHERLQAVDAAAAARIHPNDHKKLVRALEVHRLTGKGISEMQTQWGVGGVGGEVKSEKLKVKSGEAVGRGCVGDVGGNVGGVLVGLRWAVEAINARINLRVKAMFYPEKVDPALASEVCPNGEDLVSEVRRLEAAGVLGVQAREALGYKQVLAYLDGQMSLDDAFEKTKILTRRFAKTQRTWLKRYRDVVWLEAQGRTVDDLVDEAVARMGRH